MALQFPSARDIFCTFSFVRLLQVATPPLLLLALYNSALSPQQAFLHSLWLQPPSQQHLVDQRLCRKTDASRTSRSARGPRVTAAPAESRRRCLPEELVVAQHSRPHGRISESFGLLCYLLFNAYTTTWSSFVRALGFAMHSALFRARAFVCACLHFSGLLAFT
jgi:hypothetical protein